MTDEEIKALADKAVFINDCREEYIKDIENKRTRISNMTQKIMNLRKSVEIITKINKSIKNLESKPNRDYYDNDIIDQENTKLINAIGEFQKVVDAVENSGTVSDFTAFMKRKTVDSTITARNTIVDDKKPMAKETIISK